MLDLLYGVLQQKRNKGIYIKSNLLLYKRLNFDIYLAIFISCDKRHIAIIKYEFGKYKFIEM